MSNQRRSDHERPVAPRYPDQGALEAFEKQFTAIFGETPNREAPGTPASKNTRADTLRK